MAESKNMDTVLGQAAEADLEFDTIFDCEDELIDTVCGCNESGVPFTEADLEGDFDDLHNTDRDADGKDFEKDLETAGDEQGAKNPEGTEKVNDVKGSDLDSEKDGEFADLHNEDRDATPKDFEKDGQTAGDEQGAKNPEGTDQVTDVKGSDLDSKESGEFADLHNEDRDTTPKEFEKDGQTDGDAQGAKNPEGVEEPLVKEKDLNENFDIDKILDEDADFDDLHNEDRAETPKEFEKDLETAGDAQGAKNPEGVEEPQVTEKDLNEGGSASKEEGCTKKEGSEEVEEKCGDKKESCSCGKEDCPICGKGKGKKVKSIDEILDPEEDGDESVEDPEDSAEPGPTESASIDIDDSDLLEAASGDTDVFNALGDDEEVADDLKDISDVDKASGKATDLSYNGSEDEDLIDMVLGEK